MTIFDLLFLAVVLTSVVTLLFVAACLLLRRRSFAFHVLRIYAVCLALYLAAVVLVSPFVPQRVLKIGETLCFDDWCISVDGVESNASSEEVSYLVNLRLSSRARRVTQRENNLALYVADSLGHRYNPLPKPSDTPLNVRLGPGDAVLATRSFQIPLTASQPRLVIAHEGGFPVQWFILGSGPFQKAPIVWLPSPVVRSNAGSNGKGPPAETAP